MRKITLLFRSFPPWSRLANARGVLAFLSTAQAAKAYTATSFTHMQWTADRSFIPKPFQEPKELQCKLCRQRMSSVQEYQLHVRSHVKGPEIVLPSLPSHSRDVAHGAQLVPALSCFETRGPRAGSTLWAVFSRIKARITAERQKREEQLRMRRGLLAY